MEPDQVAGPTPEEMSKSETANNQYRIERQKIRGESDDKIIFSRSSIEELLGRSSQLAWRGLGRLGVRFLL